MQIQPICLLYAESFTNKQYLDLNVYVPKEALKAYQNAEPWKNFWNLQDFDPTGIESVKSDAINGNHLDAPKKGLNIINGKKVIVK